jgi:hypothetical protein
MEGTVTAPGCSLEEDGAGSIVAFVRRSGEENSNEATIMVHANKHSAKKILIPIP